jgi:hypothetical protein
MTLALALALNATTALGLVAILIYALTRPARLRPHVPAVSIERRLELALAEHPRRARPARRPTPKIPAVAAARS